MKNSSRRLRLAVAAVIALAVATALLVMSAVAPAGGNKYYSAILSPTSQSALGSPVSFSVTLYNCNGSATPDCGSNISTQYLGSANITFGTGFFSSGTTQPYFSNLSVLPSNGSLPPGAWKVQQVGNVIQVRNTGSNTSYALAPGDSVKVTGQVTPTGCGPYTLSTQAKQSNDFSGTPGNDLALAGTTPSPLAMSIGPSTSVDHFTWTRQPLAAQTAGQPIGAEITAYDACNHVVTGYSGSSFAVTLAPPNPHVAPDGVHQEVDTTPTWSGGVGTIGVIDYRAETTTLAAGDSTVQAPASSSFTVVPDIVSRLAFGPQPSETEKSKAMNPAPAVTATDAYGNPVSNVPITLTLTNMVSPGTGTATGTTATTGGSGVAVFGNLSVDTHGEYTLTANGGGASPTTSAKFLIDDKIAACNGSCSASGSVQGNTTTDASVSGESAGSLAVSVILGLTPPAGACGLRSPVPGSAGSIVHILKNGPNDSPNFTITWTLDKYYVNLVPNNGASQFDICLGAENLNYPDGVGATPWVQKNGTPAVSNFDSVLGVTQFWGILPDCPKNPTAPCVLSKNKDKAGDEVIKFYKPYPWDGTHFGV